jgi:hypothetical protein
VLEADVADERVLHHHREVARHLQLVAASDRDPVDPGDRRLADLAQAVVHVLEGAEPLPVLARLPQVLVGPGAEIGADTERTPRAGHDDDAHLVVPRRVLERARELSQHAEVEGVQDLRPVERHRRARRRLLVADPLEAELGRIAGLGPLLQGHSTSAK